MINAQYNCIVLEKDDSQFARAVELIKPTLALLHRLKQEGKLEGQPIFGVQFIGELTDDLAYCEAAPRAPGGSRFRPQAQIRNRGQVFMRFERARLRAAATSAALVATAKAVCETQAKNDER